MPREPDPRIEALQREAIEARRDVRFAQGDVARDTCSRQALILETLAGILARLEVNEATLEDHETALEELGAAVERSKGT